MKNNLNQLKIILLLSILCSVLLVISFFELPLAADLAPLASSETEDLPPTVTMIAPSPMGEPSATKEASPTASAVPATATTEPIVEAMESVEATVGLETFPTAAPADPTLIAELKYKAEIFPTAAPAPLLPTVVGGVAPKVAEEGFVISVVADSAENSFPRPTSLTWAQDGSMYISSMDGHIIRVTSDGSRSTFADGFDVPLGLAFRPGTDELYVSHRGGVTKIQDSNGDGVANEREPLLTGMHCCYGQLHQTNGIQFGPDGWLYVSQGSSSDHGDLPAGEWEAAILRVHPDKGQESLEYVATGIRNAYDLVVRADGQIFSADNGADYGPPEELNHIIPGKQYGWPHCVTEKTGPPGSQHVVSPHPNWNDPTLCAESEPAIAIFEPHLSPTGITAYEANQYPPDYQGNLFLAFWNGLPGGHRIVRVQLHPKGDTFTAEVSPFVIDLRLPTDVAVGPDGALYIVDWGAGRVYKVEYRGR